jgi:hypothetical protein
MIHSFTVTFGEQYLTGIVTSVPPYEISVFLAKKMKRLTIWEQVNPIPDEIR